MKKEEAIEKITKLLEEANKIAEENDFGNIFYNEQYIELMIANRLKHIYNKGRNEDGYDDNGLYEYKTINLSSKSNKSFQFHWLSKNKLEKYNKMKYFYFIIRKNTTIIKIYRLDKNVIMKELIKKAKEKGIFENDNIHAHKAFSLSTIINMGAKLIYEK